MTTIIGALLIGITLGLLGSGGSTITVPILVYLIGHDAKISIAESMAIVGFISAAGAIPFARSRQIDWTSVFLFGIPAMGGTFFGAYLGGLSSDEIQLIVFGIVLLVAAAIMIRRAFFRPSLVEPTPGTNESSPNKDWSPPPPSLLRYALVLVEGLVVGALTGFVGVGGGFLIVPALVILGKLPMRMAVGTSLVIITMKSLIGFAKYQTDLLHHGLSVDWNTIIVFTLIGLVGCGVGQLVNKRLNQRALMQVFAVFLVLIGGFVIFKEGSKVLNPPTPSTSIVAPAEN